MHEMLHKANGKAHKEKSGSPASILMKGHREHHSFGDTVGKIGNAAKNLAGSVASHSLPGMAYNAGKDAGLYKKGGNPHKAKKDCYAHGGSVMDSMHGTGAKTSNRDILDTFHGSSSTGARALAAGGSGKTRKGYPFT